MPRGDRLLQQVRAAVHRAARLREGGGAAGHGGQRLLLAQEEVPHRTFCTRPVRPSPSRRASVSSPRRRPDPRRHAALHPQVRHRAGAAELPPREGAARPAAQRRDPAREGRAGTDGRAAHRRAPARAVQGRARRHLAQHGGSDEGRRALRQLQHRRHARPLRAASPQRALHGGRHAAPRCARRLDVCPLHVHLRGALGGCLWLRGCCVPPSTLASFSPAPHTPALLPATAATSLSVIDTHYHHHHHHHNHHRHTQERLDNDTL